MKTVLKNVFYCGFCRKHGLSRPAMEKHELHCTLNPGRTCRWRSEVIWEEKPHHPSVDLPHLVEEVRSRVPLDDTDIDWLRSTTEGCPACMLAALRQSGVEYLWSSRGGPLFRYEEEVESFRRNEQDGWDMEERRQIEATFL